MIMLTPIKDKKPKSKKQVQQNILAKGANQKTKNPASSKQPVQRIGKNLIRSIMTSSLSSKQTKQSESQTLCSQSQSPKRFLLADWDLFMERMKQRARTLMLCAILTGALITLLVFCFEIRTDSLSARSTSAQTLPLYIAMIT